MVGHHLAVAPNHDPVGVGADLHRPPRRLGRHRVAVAVELDETGGLRTVLRARPISRAIVFTPLPRAKCSRRIFATVSNTNTPVSIRAPQAADPAIKASRTGGNFGRRYPSWPSPLVAQAIRRLAKKSSSTDEFWPPHATNSSVSRNRCTRAAPWIW